MLSFRTGWRAKYCYLLDNLKNRSRDTFKATFSSVLAPKDVFKLTTLTRYFANWRQKFQSHQPNSSFYSRNNHLLIFTLILLYLMSCPDLFDGSKAMCKLDSHGFVILICSLISQVLFLQIFLYPSFIHIFLQMKIIYVCIFPHFWWLKYYYWIKGHQAFS